MDTQKLAEQVLEDLNKKGASLGNISRVIIKKTLDDYISDSERERDVLELCKGVLSTFSTTYYNPNGPDDSTCPFCHERVYHADADISEIKHSKDCTYLIAKDLSTGLL